MPVVIDVAPIRCPEKDPRYAAEADRVTPLRKPPVSKDGTRAWFDEYGESERRKNGTIKQLMRDLDQCRNDEAKTS